MSSEQVPSVPEADKPFIIALSSVLMFAAEVVGGVVLIVTGHADAVEFLKEPIVATVGFMSTAFAFYLGNKKV